VTATTATASANELVVLDGPSFVLLPPRWCPSGFKKKQKTKKQTKKKRLLQLSIV
jgi:hypothetical protein